MHILLIKLSYYQWNYKRYKLVEKKFLSSGQKLTKTECLSHVNLKVYINMYFTYYNGLAIVLEKVKLKRKEKKRKEFLLLF